MAKPFYDLEELIVDAWPAADTLELDGWLLRHSGGPTKRGNSVAALLCAAAPGAGSAELTLAERIDRVEAFYREHARLALFQIGPCVQPKELDATLAARGYQLTGKTTVMVAAPDELCAPPSALEVRIERKASVAWSQIALHASRFADSTDALQGLLARLGSRVRYVVAYDQAVAIAACYLIASEDRLGIYGMLTLPDARRRGAALAMLYEIGTSAEREQLRELYLMVESENASANALYTRSGFRALYPYHYRLQGSGAAPRTQH